MFINFRWNLDLPRSCDSLEWCVYLEMTYMYYVTVHQKIEWVLLIVTWSQTFLEYLLLMAPYVVVNLIKFRLIHIRIISVKYHLFLEALLWLWYHYWWGNWWVIYMHGLMNLGGQKHELQQLSTSSSHENRDLENTSKTRWKKKEYKGWGIAKLKWLLFLSPPFFDQSSLFIGFS